VALGVGGVHTVPMTGQAFTLGMFQGFAEVEHTVPLGCTVVHSKLCELCGLNMFVENGTRYCSKCEPIMFPESLSTYNIDKEIQQAWRELHPTSHVRRGAHPSLGDWKTKLFSAFVECGPLSYRQMREVTGHCSVNTMKTALSLCMFEFEHVGSVWPRRSRLGHPEGLFLPPEMACPKN